MTFTHPILLKTKTSRPAIKPYELVRERITQMMSQNETVRLLSVCAPAGYGKTTALNHWAQASGVPAIWVSLDERDNDSLRFWRYMIHALSQVVQQDTKAGIAALLDELPGLSRLTIIDALINEMHACGETVTVLLDDYHVIENGDIHEELTYFLDYAPDVFRLAIASRLALPFAIAKWEATGRCLRVDTDALAFNQPEMQAFYRRMLPARDPSDYARLSKRTEGWAVGMQLLALSMGGMDKLGEPADDDVYLRKVGDYLLEEVLAAMDVRTRRFVLETSVLQQMDARLCAALLGDEQAGLLLDQLYRQRLFLYPIDGSGWFRYHALFATYLQGELRRLQPGAWQDVHRRASRCLAARGLYEEALEHAFLAEDYGLAEDLLNRYLPVILRQGELSALQRWFNGFPAWSWSARSSELLLRHAFIAVLGGHREIADALMAQTRQRLAACPLEEQVQIQSGLLFVRSNLLFMSGQFQEWFDFADGIMEELLPKDALFYHFNYNTAFAFARMTGLGRGGVLNTQMEKIAHAFGTVLSRHGWGESLIHLYVQQTLGEGYLEWNRLADAQQRIDEVYQAAICRSVPGLYIPNRLTQAMLYEASGNRQMAFDVLNEALGQTALLAESHWHAYLLAARMELELSAGNVQQARRTAAALHLGKEHAPTYRYVTQWLAMSRLMDVRGRTQEALGLLEPLRAHAVREGSLMNQVQIAVLQARYADHLGYGNQARRYLREALALAEPCGYVRSFVREGAVMARLLDQVVAEGDTAENRAVVDYASRLAGQFAASVSPAPLAAAGLAPSERRLLELVAEGASNKQIAARLGLTEGTVKVYLSRIYNKLGVSSRIQALAAAGMASLE